MTDLRKKDWRQGDQFREDLLWSGEGIIFGTTVVGAERRFIRRYLIPFFILKEVHPLSSHSLRDLSP